MKSTVWKNNTLQSIEIGRAQSMPDRRILNVVLYYELTAMKRASGRPNFCFKKVCKKGLEGDGHCHLEGDVSLNESRSKESRNERMSTREAWSTEIKKRTR